MNIYVGNLSNDTNDEDLQQAFASYGRIESASVLKDRYSGESRGFGFVEMPDKNEAQAAIAGLNGTELKGRMLSVNEARPRPDSRRGGSGGSGGSGGGRGGGGGRWGGGGGGGRRF